MVSIRQRTMLCAAILSAAVLACTRSEAPTPKPTEAPPTAIAAKPEPPTVAAPTPLFVATPAPSPTEARPAAPPAAQRVRVSGAGADGVNMRAEPSTTAGRVKLLKEGAELELVGEDHQGEGRTWRNVKDPSDGATGWVAADFVVAADAAPAPAVAPPLEKPAAAPATAAPKPVAPSKPPPAPGTIVCADGFVQNRTTRQGACAGHGGIAPGY